MANEGNRDKNFMEKSIRLEELPNELLLKIFSFLEITNLLNCSQTSKRIRVICYDDSLWQKINLSKKKVTTEFLQKVIGYGCKSLNLNEAKIVGTLSLENESPFTDLDLSACSATSHILEELLRSCHYLQKLTLTQPLNFDTLSAVTSQNGKTLQVLNCWWGYSELNVESPIWRASNLSLPSIRLIIENCTELRELNFWNGVFPDAGPCHEGDISYHCWIHYVDYLVNNMSPNIEKFSIQDGPFCDEHIKILVSRCTKLKELRLSCMSIKNASLTYIIDHLTPKLEKLELDNVGIDYKRKFELKLMPKLKSLNCLCYRWEIVHELREELPDISVNGYPPMATVCKKKKVEYGKLFYNDFELFRCITCYAKFEEKKGLNEHVSNVHVKENPFNCDLCKSSFTRINELHHHRNSVHENTAPHRCESCNEDYFSENMG